MGEASFHPEFKCDQIDPYGTLCDGFTAYQGMMCYKDQVYGDLDSVPPIQNSPACGYYPIKQGCWNLNGISWCTGQSKTGTVCVGSDLVHYTVTTDALNVPSMIIDGTDANSSKCGAVGSDGSFSYGNKTGDIPIVGDWIGSGKDTIGIFRDGVFYLRNSNNNGAADITFPFGAPGDIPVVWKQSRGGKSSIGIVRNGTFYLKKDLTPGAPDLVFNYGSPDDKPLMGDWSGIGYDTVGLFRGGVFYLRNTNDAGVHDILLNYGSPTDIPIIGDWNGDKIDGVGIYTPSTGTFHLGTSTGTDLTSCVFDKHQTTDIPLAGDWNGDGKDEIGIYNAGTFTLKTTCNLTPTPVVPDPVVPTPTPTSGNNTNVLIFGVVALVGLGLIFKLTQKK